ncbi:MAG: hypothetical protein LC799_22445, partial [Actinobacteria bacterium]|nr:hypothetical protein [Actinomycetota bacterium]
ALTRAGAGGGGGREPDAHAVAEPGDQLVLDRGRDRVEALLAGEVGLVDQFAQRVGDLGWPVFLGVDLGGSVKIPE